jgi:pimeloyl-ACP methyl ester carboxylesterase
VAHPNVVEGLAGAGARLRARGHGAGVYAQQVSRALRPLSGPGARAAFLQTLRSVIDVRGQRVSAVDRLYLLEAMPTLVVWGERDHTIPIEHGRAAHAAIPHSRFATLPKAAHFPHIDDPDGLAAVLREFLETTSPAHIDAADWHELVAPRSQRRRRMSAVA